MQILFSEYTVKVVCNNQIQIKIDSLNLRLQQDITSMLQGKQN